MDGVLVCAQRGDASKRRPIAPTIADAATTLHPAIADEAAVLIVLVNRETSLCSITLDPLFERALGFECPDAAARPACLEPAQRSLVGPNRARPVARGDRRLCDGVLIRHRVGVDRSPGE